MIGLGSDHAGFKLKEEIKEYLDSIGEEYKDYGAYSQESVDYPDFAYKTSWAIVSGECDRGILICGTGVGISIAANKVKGIRAACCGDYFTAKHARLHNDANILCLGARVIGAGLAMELADVFIHTEFEGGKHAGRIGKIAAIEKGEFN